MNHHLLVIGILKTITVLLGLLFLFYAGRAYRKHRTRALAVLILAIGLMTFGAVVEGVAVNLWNLPLEEARIVEASTMLAAFAVLVYSLLVPERRRRVIRHDPETGDDAQ